NGTIGIGHTRWATHGEPSVTNSHPHQSHNQRFTLVHNGVIENYKQLKVEYLNDVDLVSDTDTEIIVQLIAKFADEGSSTLEAFRKTLSLLHGSYAIGLLDNEDNHTIYAAKNKSPLLLGKGDGFNVITSDAMAMLNLTNEFVELMDGEVIQVMDDKMLISDNEGTEIERESYIAEIDASDTELGTYPHYMIKEINEQPQVMRKIIKEYQDDNGELDRKRTRL